jgi:oligosaccharide repeat unit polymerase
MLAKESIDQSKTVNHILSKNRIKIRQLSLKARVVLLAAALSILSGLRFSLNESPFLEAQVAYAIPTTIVLLVIGFVALRKGLLGLLNPVVSLMVGFLLFFSAAPLINPSNSNLAIGIYSDPSRFLPLAGVYLLGLTAFLVGLFLARQPRASPRGQKWLGFEVDANKLWKWYLVIVLIAAAYLAALIILNGLNPIEFFFSSRYAGGQRSFSHPLSRYLDQLLRYFIMALGSLSGIIFALSDQPKRHLIALSVIALSALYILAGGVRFHFLYLVGGTILVWWHLSSSMNKTKLTIPPLRLILIGVMVVFLMMQMIAIRNTPGGLLNYLSGGPRFVSLDAFIDNGIDRNIGLEQALIAVPARRSYVGGLSFISMFTAFVPRVLWANKPTTAWAYMAGYTIFDQPNTSFTILGELHINFGFPGIVFGMLIIGIFTQNWHRLYLMYQKTVPMTTFYSMSLLVFAFLVRGDFQTAVGTIFYAMLIVLFVLRTSRKSNQK